jgi:hypothetical protein
MIVFIYIEQYILSIKENMMYQNYNGMFNYRITFITFVFIYMEQYILSIKKNMICQDSNRMFNYRIKFKFN